MGGLDTINGKYQADNNSADKTWLAIGAAGVLRGAKEGGKVQFVGTIKSVKDENRLLVF